MTSVIGKIFGTKNSRYLKKIKPIVEKINALEADIQPKSDDEIRAAVQALKERYKNGETLDQLLPESFALTREAAKRTMGLRPFDVQLKGGIILHQGKVAEMKTGEGKTLMATLAVSLNALTGEGVHVVTVNDYLAQRDAEWMQPVYEFLGFSAGFVVAGMDQDMRKAAYQADITYATNNELGFDYLRDNMAYDESQLVQRGQPFAIVDEVDSILIDEARTPLVISGPTDDRTELYQAINVFIDQLQAGEDFEKDEKTRSISLTDAGTDKAEDLLRKQGLLKEGEGIYDIHHVALVHHLNNALKAHHLFSKDVNYIVKDGAVILIDEFTGRMSEGRRLSDGLHQAIECKEGVDIQQENQSLASITYQNYFRLYHKLAGMTGTAETEQEEFQEIYNLDVIVVPTNVPVARDDVADIVFRKVDAKVDAVVADVKETYAKGQPILVGTTSIEKSEDLHKRLKKEKIPHKVLNARYHDQEAEIIAQAGRKGAVTIATNMAGRGTDIKLGGNLELLLAEAKDEKEQEKITAEHAQEKAEVLEAGGLRVVGTERHESRRIDNQLRGRSGRQGDPGSTVFYLSLQDDLMRIFATNLDALMGRFNMPEDESIQHPWISKSIETAQRKIEGMYFDNRKHILKFDNVLNEQRKVIYEQRREILEAEKVDDTVQDFRLDMIDYAVDNNLPLGVSEEQWDVTGLEDELGALFAFKVPVAEWLEEGIDRDELITKIEEAVKAAVTEKEQRIGEDLFRSLEKHLLLQIVDRLWRGHLQQLDYLRQGINLRGYAQKNPIDEYSKESFVMFDNMLMEIRREMVMLMSRVEVDPTEAAELERMEAEAAPDRTFTPLTEEEMEDPAVYENTPRNAPCPCGSGKKYKYCHGAIERQKSA